MAGKTICVFGSYAEGLIRLREPLLTGMRKLGHRIIAMAPAITVEIASKLAAIGVEHRTVPLDRNSVSWSHDLRTIWVLRRLFSEIKPDVILSYNIKPVIYGSITAYWSGVPERYSMITGLGYAFAKGGGGQQRLIGILAALLYRLSIRTNRRVFFQNPDDRAFFERMGLLRFPLQAVMINGSGIDLDEFRPVPLPDTPSFLLIARLLKDKGVREYVAATKLLRARYPRAQFRLAGRQDSHPASISASELQAWVEEGAVDYLGPIKDVRPAISAASVYVLPSYYPEGTPRTVLEAMAMGRPIVTTDTPGCRETVREGVNGYLVPVRNAPALATVMEKFILQPRQALHMGRESRRIAEMNYDVNDVNKVMLDAMALA